MRWDRICRWQFILMGNNAKQYSSNMRIFVPAEFLSATIRSFFMFQKQSKHTVAYFKTALIVAQKASILVVYCEICVRG